MSRETLTWLNQNCLIGYTGKYGRAWHYDEASQGAEPNHYDSAIPVEDVRRRLFSWEAQSIKAQYQFNGATRDLPGQVIIRSDTGDVLGNFGEGYQIHQYSEWLIDKVSTLVDAAAGELGIGSAVLLQGGAVAAVQIEAPDSVTVGGDQLRPFICATTSLNGKFVTSYKRGTTRVVCDNTLDEFHNSASAEFKIKHTKNSKAKISEVRQALQIAFTHQAAEMAEIERLMAQVVTDEQFAKIIEMIDPVKVDTDGVSTGRGETRNENRRNAYWRLWQHDARVGDYKGTAWGTVQVFNTYQQHIATTRKNTVKVESNMFNFLSGKTGKSDLNVLAAVNTVCV